MAQSSAIPATRPELNLHHPPRLQIFALTGTLNPGNNSLDRPEQVRAELRAGMRVGNHTFTHPHLPATATSTVHSGRRDDSSRSHQSQFFVNLGVTQPDSGDAGSAY